MAFNYSPRIVTDGLVLYLDAANSRSYPGSGTTWSDMSRNECNGVLTNGPTFSSANGGSIVFDGVNDYVNLGDPSILRLGASNFSINTWVKTTDTSLNGSILVKRQQVSPFNLINLGIGSWSELGGGGFDGLASKKIRISLRENASNQYVAYTTDDIIDGLWKNISITRTSGIFNLYANGINQSLTIIYNTGTGINSNISVSGSNWSAGAVGDIGVSHLIGNISIAQIYNRALSATEVLQNYNATRTRFGL